MTSKGDEDAGYQDEMVASVGAYGHGSYDFGLRKRKDRLRPHTRRLRSVCNYAVYFRAQHNSPQLARAPGRPLPAALRRFLATAVGRRLVSSDRLPARLPRAAGRPARRRRAGAPGGAGAPRRGGGLPVHLPLSADVEYVRAARQLGIPTVAAVASWDNLSTKGTFALLPIASWCGTAGWRRRRS